MHITDLPKVWVIGAGAIGCVCLSFLGGACTRLSQVVRQVVRVGWSEMLTHYRRGRLKIEGLGQTIDIDAHGRSFYADAKKHASEQSPCILDALGTPRGGS